MVLKPSGVCNGRVKAVCSESRIVFFDYSLIPGCRLNDICHQAEIANIAIVK